MILSHKIALDPTFKQAKYFAQAAGTARFTWNWALEHWNLQYNSGEKPSAFSLKKQFNATKYESYPWLRNIHRDAHSQPFSNLQKAFNRFFKKVARYPKFKKKGAHDSFYVANDRVSVKGKQVRLPKIGWIRLREELRFVGRILGATVSREANRWFIAIQVDEENYTKNRCGNGVVGVDLGVKNLATLSTGEVVESPKPLKKNLKKLKRLSRRLSRKQAKSKNRKKARKRVARLHQRIRNIRKDTLDKLTTRLCYENQVVVIEDLNVRGMLRNHKLARAISDIGFGEFRRQLEYKSIIFGTQIILADRWFPSSKKCSSCGRIKSDLSLSDRIYRCEWGLVEDRDLNAALDLCTLSLRGS